MAVALRLNVRLKIVRDYLPALASRIRNLAPAWGEIIKSWVVGNKQKFESLKGFESTGTWLGDGDLFLAQLTERYLHRKRDRAEEEEWPGSQDWLMVMSGELMESLTNRDHSEWFERIDPMHATFGSTDPVLTYHQYPLRPGTPPRPTSFLDERDQRSIKTELFDWLNGNPPYPPMEMQPDRTYDAVLAFQMEEVMRAA